MHGLEKCTFQAMHRTGALSGSGTENSSKTLYQRPEPDHANAPNVITPPGSAAQARSFIVVMGK